MKILLTAVNAKYIHSNLAVYSLKAYVKPYDEHVKIVEFTINNHLDDLLRAIYKEKPDVIAFSCYIWNVNMIKELVIELKKILPKVKIWLGGPEVSFDSDELLERYLSIDGIIVGEGEATFKELIRYYLGEITALNAIKGLVYREDNGSIITTEPRPLLALREIPFAYNNIHQFENKIIYYETSRGCPFSCQYCLSSVDKKLRFRDLTLVKYELKQFLDAKVKQVKFVDRTFNCNKKHALAIWQYLKVNDNGLTNFHFEISADLIDDEMLEVLSTVRPGLFQFEIGVQSTHLETLDIIQRKMDFEKLSEVIGKINLRQNIHQHLDLIAGLPKESFTVFKKSFNDVYALEPEQLQLGFLKVLKGSGMYYKCKKYGILYKEQPPYEVLETDALNYEEVLKLKMIEEMVELYFNSGQFTYTLKYMESFYDTPFDLYEALASYYEVHQLHTLQHARLTRYNIVLDFIKEQEHLKIDLEILQALMLLDLYLQENLKKRPKWARDNNAFKEKIRERYQSVDLILKYLPEYKKYSAKQISRMTHVEVFPINFMPFIEKGERTFKREATYVLFNYKNRNPLNHHAKIFKV